MIITTPGPQCRKYQGENIIKNGHNRSDSPQCLCKACGAHGVLTSTARYTDEQKETILNAYRTLAREYIFFNAQHKRFMKRLLLGSASIYILQLMHHRYVFLMKGYS